MKRSIGSSKKPELIIKSNKKTLNNNGSNESNFESTAKIAAQEVSH